MAAEYAAVKRELAAKFHGDRHGYAQAKAPFLWQAIRQADEWAQATGWLPGPSSA